MFRRKVVGILVAAVAIASTGAAQQANRWAVPKCDLKPAHFLVNSGLLYLRSATETKFEDQKQKDLRDANRVLMQALTTAGQDKNPAARYYLARYYVMTQDLVGADSTFRRAEALKPDCAEDITVWRRFVWVPALNAGIGAWQANNADSAMKAFRQANAILQTEPQGFKYLASLLYNAGQRDSAFALYRRIVARGDSGGSLPLFRAGVEIYTAAPEAPDTSAAGKTCRGTRPLLARIRACRDSLGAVMREH